MLEAGAHLLQVINRVLDLSEVESGHAELRLSEIDPRDVGRVCLNLVRPTAEAKGLALEFITLPDVPPRLTTDMTRLRQVLLNLLGNAVKFTIRGRVELRLRPAPDGVGLRFEVADTGPGIPVQRRSRLFQEFERLDAEVDGPVEGAGLGLAIVARFAALLGGSVGYESDPGGGSVFWLQLPIDQAANRDRRYTDAPAKVDPAAPLVRELRILVVDDTLMNREITSAFLRAAAHTVTCAESGADAIAAVASTDFDVVLMDVRMPGMDGIEATRRIRAMAGPRARVPIMALTAQAFTEQLEVCLQAGMDSHLSKPFTPEALQVAVANTVVVAKLRGKLTVDRQ
jgi:CheY-like chemotaxis protein/two-component sensor histidine kinase